MSKMKAFLKNVHIENFRSLRDVTLPLKPLTVLVGPNACGKSNVLNALSLCNRMTVSEVPPPVDIIRGDLWAGEASHITFQLQAEMNDTLARYHLVLKEEVDNPFVTEELSVGDVQVISIQHGEGVVRDENGENETPYKANNLALRSAGAYGHKPATSALSEFLQRWKFYDFQPEFIRDRLTPSSATAKELREYPQLDSYGFRLSETAVVLAQKYTRTFS